MQIGVVAAVHRRPWVTSLFYHATHRLREQWQPHTTTIYVAGDDELLDGELAVTHRHMAHQHGAVFCEAPNDPLGAKYNVAFQRALADGMDRVVLMGSDDLLTPAMARRYLGVLDHPHLKYAGLMNSVVIRPFTAEAAILLNHRAPFRRYEPMGPGRILAREVLAALKGCPFHPLKGKGGLDYNMTQQLVHRAGITDPDIQVSGDTEAMLVDVKGGGPGNTNNISMFDRLLTQATIVRIPYPQVLQQLPQNEQDIIWVLSGGVS